MGFQVLMVCTGNICRSPMAEVILKAKLPPELKDKIDVQSAGIHAIDGNAATSKAIEVMGALNIDMSGHRARFLTLDMLEAADLVIVMERAHMGLIHTFYPSEKDKAHMLSEFGPDKKRFDIPDPYGESTAFYKKSAALIDKCVAGVLTYLRERELT